MHDVFEMAGGRIHSVHGLGLCRVPTIGPGGLLALSHPMRVLRVLAKRHGTKAVDKESRSRHHVDHSGEVGRGFVEGELAGVFIGGSSRGSLIGVAAVGSHGGWIAKMEEKKSFDATRRSV